MDVVYLVRPGDRNEELRHSLRSLVNVDHDRVFFVGHLPEWVTGVEHVPGNRRVKKEHNVYDNVRLACDADVSDTFLLFNDDFFVMRPTPIRVWWRWTLDDHINHVRRSTWRTSLEVARTWLTAQGFTDLRSYELHVPFLVDKAKMAEVLRLAEVRRNAIPGQWRTLYGNFWQVGGEQMPDCKVGRGVIPDGPFLSTHDRAFQVEEIGRHVRAAFPDPCRYEV